MLKPRQLLGLIFACWLGITTLTRGEVVRDTDTDQAQFRARVAALIQQLGEEEYIRREHAAEQLRRMGLAAFDDLVQAQEHEDAEIRLRAQNLVRSFRIAWVSENDPETVKRLLKDYQALRPFDRITRITWISSLENAAGIDATCRIARFERSPLLSKQAALQVMRYDVSTDLETQQQVIDAILHAVGNSQRPAAKWLRVYVSYLSRPNAAFDAWKSLIAEEDSVARQDSAAPRQLLIGLLRWYAEALTTHQGLEAAEETARRMVELETERPEGLSSAADWLLDQQAWPLFEELAEKFPKQFSEEATYIYCRAEALRKQNRTAEAEELAQRALQVEAEAASHAAVAARLEQRGLIDWAVREYYQVFDLTETGSSVDVWTRTRVAELLHDQARDKEAGDILKVAVDLTDSNRRIAGRMRSLPRDPGAIKSRMYFFFAEHFRRQVDRTRQIEHLRKAIEADPTDADVLIGMYRLQAADEAWKSETRELIKNAVQQFAGALTELKRQSQGVYQMELASTYNQLAWLIGNTEGDYEAAVDYSHRSLDLRPQTAGYLDTLGRCYFALKDYENAVKYQRRAVKLEPHSGQIRRQLLEFEKVLSGQTASSPSPGA